MICEYNIKNQQHEDFHTWVDTHEILQEIVSFPL
jgi:hypothetical protein